MRSPPAIAAAVLLGLLFACCGGDTQPANPPQLADNAPDNAPPKGPLPAGPGVARGAGAPPAPIGQPPPAEEDEPYQPPSDWCGTGGLERPAPVWVDGARLRAALKPEFGPWMPTEEKGIDRRLVTSTDLHGKPLRLFQYRRRVDGAWVTWSRAEEGERRRKGRAPK